MPLRLSTAQSGFSLHCDAGSDADFGTLGGLSALVDSAFTLCVDIQFQSNAECVFFGGTGTGTRDLYLTRNLNGTRDDSIEFSSTDASGDVRTVKWNGVQACNDWKTLMFVSSAAGANNLNLYVNNVLATITSQTHDAGFNADEAFDLRFGEVDTGKICPFNFTNLYVYNRALTAAEREQITYAGAYPDDYLRGYPFYFPNMGVDRTLLTPVVD